MTKGMKIFLLVVGLFVLARIVSSIGSGTAPPAGEQVVPTPVSETGTPKVTRPPVPRVLQLASALDDLSAALISNADAVEQDILDQKQGKAGEQAVTMATGWRTMAKDQSHSAESIRHNPEAAAHDEMWAKTRQGCLIFYSALTNAASIEGTPTRTKAALEDVAKHVRVVIDLTKPGQSW